MPNQITDAVITKVYQGKSGTSQFGDWIAYNFYVQGEDKKFSWFGGGNKITPVDGMQIAYMEYTTTIEGKYTNHKVSKLTVKEGVAQPTTLSSTKPQSANGREASFYVSYAKDIAIALLNRDGVFSIAVLEDTCRQVAQAGLIMMNESLGNAEIPSEKPPEAQELILTEKPKDTPPIDKANDPREDMVKCEAVNEDGTDKHKMAVSAIFCLTSCMETAHCSVAKDLRDKYPGYELE